MATYLLVPMINSLLLLVFQHACLKDDDNYDMMNNQNKSQLLGVSVFMGKGGTKICSSVNYGLLPVWEFLAEDSKVGEFLVCTAE